MRTRDIVGVLCVAAALTLSCALAQGAPVSLAGGLLLTGEAMSYSVAASLPVLAQPRVDLDLLWGPEQGQAALGVSTPVRTALDPLADLAGWQWSDWAQAALDRVSVGVAGWRTNDQFPVRGGLYWRVTALEWEF